jgi:hypothetical protein
MLPEFAAFRAVWVEITSSHHGHGGPGWEFGTCLWSPVVDEGGAARYQVMWEPEAGDLVLHFYRHTWDGQPSCTQLCGFSLVHQSCREVTVAPPTPGRWVAPAYYRIDLTGYQPLATRLNPEALNKHPDYLARVRQELVPNRPARYPFSSYGPLIRVTQGQYLTRCTALLYQVLQDALGLDTLPLSADTIPAPATASARRPTEYQEGQRKLREAYFFTRNPRLAAEVKRLRDYTCEVCHFNFRQHYGVLGQDYAECHHKNPLSERPEELWSQALTTSLDDVAVLCANCHRMVHRQRPALAVESLRAHWLAAQHAANTSFT